MYKAAYNHQQHCIVARFYILSLFDNVYKYTHKGEREKNYL